MRAQFVASEIGVGLRRNLTMTIAVIVTVTVSMFFLGSAMLLRSQVDLSRSYWYGEIQLSIYLCGTGSQNPNCDAHSVTQQERDDILRQLQASPDVQNVVYESKQQAYKRFVEQNKGTALAKLATPDQLPESYQVKLKNPERYEVVATAFANMKGVDKLLDYRKTLQQLFGFLRGMLVVAFGVAIVMLVTAALLIFNTIRLAAFNRRRETGIMKLVGASSFYIQLPFVLEGVISALLGTALAFGLLSLAFFRVTPWLQSKISFTPYIAFGSVLQALLVMLAVGVSISALASWLTLRRYLRV